MRLTFPNSSRSFDAASKRVCFWAYDKTIEISFYVEVEALKRLFPDLSEIEADYLKAFDEARTRIYEIADKVYGNGGKHRLAIVLAAQDF